ncbi:Indole-3-glycerol phosphate synthase [Gracilaria domingensis]|nr:Indole-3-glycerol phosphate synthase [Gracilaria domingensis]
MRWTPSGLLREAVDLKKMEIELMESTLQERPDHPINMCRSFYAQKTSHRFSKALRRRDRTLSIVGAMKRFQPPRPGEKAVKIADLEDIGREARALSVTGVDAAFVFTDMMRYGVETKELAKVTHVLKTSNVELGMPVARQDVIIDAVQIAEAVVAGAAAVNIIAAAALPEIMELMNAATAMGIETVVECHTELERDFALECGATILYLTNWDRSRNVLVPRHAERLIEGVPPWVLTIGGGGLVTARDCWSLLDHGFNGVVLGTTLLQTRRLRSFTAEIRSQKREAGDMFAGDFETPFQAEAM